MSLDLWQFGGNSAPTSEPSQIPVAWSAHTPHGWIPSGYSRPFSAINCSLKRAGSRAGIFKGVQEYVASYLIEHLDYALGNLFPTTFESFNPAGMPTLEVRFFPVPDFYVKSAVLSGNRNPYQPAPPELTSKFAIPLILSLK